jgi:hypothetical protein
MSIYSIKGKINGQNFKKGCACSLQSSLFQGLHISIHSVIDLGGPGNPCGISPGSEFMHKPTLWNKFHRDTRAAALVSQVEDSVEKLSAEFTAFMIQVALVRCQS